MYTQEIITHICIYVPISSASLYISLMSLSPHKELLHSKNERLTLWLMEMWLERCQRECWSCFFLIFCSDHTFPPQQNSVSRLPVMSSKRVLTASNSLENHDCQPAQVCD